MEYFTTSLIFIRPKQVYPYHAERISDISLGQLPEQEGLLCPLSFRAQVSDLKDRA